MKLAQGQRVLFIGDSITDAGRDYDNYYDLGNGYAHMAGSLILGRYADLQLEVLNRGINGHKLQDLAERWQKDCLELKPDILDEFFALNGTEVSYHELFSYLYMHDDIESYSDRFGEIGLKERVIESYIEKLIRADRLLFTSEFRIRPQSLPKDCAAAAL